MKAGLEIASPAVSNGSKILKWKQITTALLLTLPGIRCFQWFKDTKMKANHNRINEVLNTSPAVSNGSKILKWKQITTNLNIAISYCCCFQWFKDTKMKANHNRNFLLRSHNCAVSNGSKILKWKQITTRIGTDKNGDGCFQWFKDTKMKANHNPYWSDNLLVEAVSNGSKILKWKQITTLLRPILPK